MSFPMAGQDSQTGGFDGDSGGAPQNGGGVHPAWNDVLNVIPKELHNQVIPHFQRWDQNVGKVHQRYEPYKQFLGTDPSQIQQAMQIAQALERDPQGVYQLLHEEFGNAAGPQGQGQGLPGQEFASEEGEDPYEGLHPAVVEKLRQFDEMQGGFNTMAEILLAQKQQASESEEDAELDALYQQLEQSNPTFAALNKDGMAEPYINSMLEAGYEPEDAMERFMAFVEAVGQFNNRPKPPMVLGAGGSLIPGGSGIKPSQMNRGQTKDFVAQTLKAALQSGQ